VKAQAEAFPGAGTSSALGLFSDPWTYRVLLAARSWLDDLAAVLMVSAGAIVFELVGNHSARVSSILLEGGSPIDHLALALRAQIWFPVVLAGVAVLACTRLRSQLGPEPSLGRLVRFAGAAVAILALAALRLNECPGSWPTRFAPLIVTAATLFATSKWRRRGALRGPTDSGLRPPLRTLFSPSSLRALAGLRVGIPRGGFITTNVVDDVLARATRTFALRGDCAAEAYAHARVVEHALARGRIVEAEARLEEASADGRLREQPALMCARAMLLQSVGLTEEAVELLDQALRRVEGRKPVAMRSLLSQARLRAGVSEQQRDNERRDWARLVYLGHPGAVLVEVVLRIQAVSRTRPDVALREAHSVLAVAGAVVASPLADLDIGELERIEESRGEATLLIARLCERGRSWRDAANAYLDAIPAFMFIRDRTRTAECFVRGSSLLIAKGQGSAAQESHALDLMRVAFELTEAERGGLRQGSARAAWVRHQRALLGVAFGALATGVRWHPEKAAELGLWLMESLHRTTIAAAARNRIAATDAELSAKLEELARAEAASVSSEAFQQAAPRPSSPESKLAAQGSVAQLRKEVMAQFSRTRDAALVLDPVDVEQLRSKAGAAVALSYGCMRDEAGWTIDCALTHPRGEHLVRSQIPDSEDDPCCRLLDVIAGKQHDALALAFATPMWDASWDTLATRLLPPQLSDLLPLDGNDVADVVIVPDGPLAAVPFAGLRLRDGRTLLDVAHVRLVPSLGLIEKDRSIEGSPVKAVVTHLDDRGEAAVWQRIARHVRVRATSTRAELESALEAEPPADLAVIMGHGQVGDAAQDNVMLLNDSAMSATAALRLSWPGVVVLGSCWIGEGEVAAGDEPFGFPIACLMNGTHTVLGAVSPVPRSEVSAILSRIATELPTATTLADMLRRAILPAREWPTLTIWSTVPGAESAARDIRPTTWDERGLPRSEPAAGADSGRVRLSLPLSDEALALFVREQGRSRRGTVGLSGLLSGICGEDPVCSRLPGAAEMQAAVAVAPLDAELPDRVLVLGDSSSPVYLTEGVAEALKVAEAFALDVGVAAVSTSLLAFAAVADERTERRISAHPAATRFVEILGDRLERYSHMTAPNERPHYDEDLARRIRERPRQPASDLLRYGRRIGWGVAFVILAMLGTGLTGVEQLQRASAQRGYLGVRVESSSSGLPEIGAVYAGTPAARSGIQAGDEIETVDGIGVATAGEAVLQIERHRPGEVVRLRVSRDNRQLMFSARLGELP
jgi:hypothetical protein